MKNVLKFLKNYKVFLKKNFFGNLVGAAVPTFMYLGPPLADSLGSALKLSKPNFLHVGSIKESYHKSFRTYSRSYSMAGYF